MPANPYHIKITIDPAGSPTEVGLVLSKPEDEPLQYSISEIGPPAALRLSAEQAKYADYPIEVEAVWAQSNFQDGLGFRMWDSEHPGGYDNNNAGVLGGWIAAGAHKIVPAPPFKTTGTVDSNGLPLGMADFFNGSDTRTFLVTPGISGRVWRSDTSGVTFASVLNHSSASTDGLHVWGTYILLAVGITNSRYHYATDGADTTWAQRASATGDTQDYFIPGKDVVWGFRNPNTLRNTSDPSDSGTWSGATTVGDDRTDHTIVAGFELEGVLIIVRTDAIFAVDAAANVTKVVSQFEKDNSIRLAATDGVRRVYFEARGEIWEYDIFSGVITRTETWRVLSTQTVEWDSIAYHNGFIFASAASDALFARAHWREGRWVWEKLVGIVLSGGTFLHPTGAYGSNLRFRVYMGVHGTNVYYFDMANAEDVTIDSSQAYFSASALDSPRFDNSWPGVEKIYDYATVEFPVMAGSDWSVQISYSIDEAAFTNLGSAVTSAGLTRLAFPSGTSGRRMQLRATTSSGGSDPITEEVAIASWDVHAHVRFRYKRLFEAAVRIADGLTDRRGGAHNLKGDTIRTRLQAARTSTARVQWQDYFGNNVDVFILSPLIERASRDENASDTESEMLVRAVEVGTGS